MSSSKFGSHMQTLVQTGKMDRLEQEVHELRGEVTTLRAESYTNGLKSVLIKLSNKSAARYKELKLIPNFMA
ncbi:hypothetical protein MTR_4g058030 [Medicago truncatula]|uniref:Uncharacterized protein n=1 Tax=Medicago truncatula TaxID=3880 RepID=A0A072UJU2_MEDTR|nr:hypothetical protein MTR_4g058030 [Medicago truncatula]